MIEAQPVKHRLPESSLSVIRHRLREMSQRYKAHGWPSLTTEGKLLRPQVAAAVAQALSPALLEDECFWGPVLAVQMVHEASLAHDDIIDQAKERRGQPTVVASKGVGAALLLGDHLLTASYRWVAQSQELELTHLFAQAVERTVAGEGLQARKRGTFLGEDVYRQIILQKTGFLFGFAFSIAPILCKDPRVSQMTEVGCELGALYQMLDDLLDYCALANTGKPPYQDYLQRKTTWPLLLLMDKADWNMNPEELRYWMFGAQDKEPPHSVRLLRYFVHSCQKLELRIRELLGEEHTLLFDLLNDWQLRARQALMAEEQYFVSAEIVPFPKGNRRVLQEREEQQRQHQMDSLHERLKQEGLDSVDSLQSYFEHHSRSFSFASLFFGPGERHQIARLYAWCRFTDDLADDPELSPEESRSLLTLWKELCQQAYAGNSTGIVFLDEVMHEMAERNVPFKYAEELIAGMEMDLNQDRYQTLDDLHLYCYRVASVVGLWMTELFGVHDVWVLERATALGYAMQLTNILRDVGEDLERGRVYLPLELLKKYGLSVEALQRLKDTEGPLPAEYTELLEELLMLAERYYRKAFAGIPHLPGFFQKPVVIAAFVYRGIHSSLRANRYDNLRLRAHTSLWSKLKLAWRGWRFLRTELALQPGPAHNLLPESTSPPRS